MSDPYIGEIRMFGGNFAPVGWLFCNGQTVPISEYDTLFNLIGTTYGGDGQETFGLPDLQGRVPLHRGPNNQQGEQGGEEQVTVTPQQIPSHNHAFQATSALANQPTPGGNVPAQAGTLQMYIDASAEPPTTPLSPDALLPYKGGGGPHENMPPYQVISYIISMFGIYPTPS